MVEIVNGREYPDRLDLVDSQIQLLEKSTVLKPECILKLEQILQQIKKSGFPVDVSYHNEDFTAPDGIHRQSWHQALRTLGDGTIKEQLVVWYYQISKAWTLNASQPYTEGGFNYSRQLLNVSEAIRFEDLCFRKPQHPAVNIRRLNPLYHCITRTLNTQGDYDPTGEIRSEHQNLSKITERFGTWHLLLPIPGQPVSGDQNAILEEFLQAYQSPSRNI